MYFPGIRLLAAAIAVPAADSPEKEVQYHMLSGNRAYREKNYADAERRFQRAVTEAEKLGEDDARLARALEALAGVERPGGTPESSPAPSVLGTRT